MREAAITFPTMLSNEEKHLKEMFEKLKAVRKAIAMASRSNVGAASGEAGKAERKNAKRSIQQAEEATKEVKRKVMAGAINLKKANEKKTFKRSKILEKRRESESKLKLDTSDHGNSSGNEMLSPTGSSFLSPPYSQDTQDAMKVNRGPTLYIRGYDLQTESLQKVFEKYGRITRLFIEDRRKSAFITLSTTEQAEEAIKEMDGNMVNGITLRVSFARRQNQTTPRNVPNLFPRRRSSGSSDWSLPERGSDFKSPTIGKSDEAEGQQPSSPALTKQTSSVQMAWNQATERTTNARRRNDSRTLIDYSEDSSFSANDSKPAT